MLINNKNTTMQLTHSLLSSPAAVIGSHTALYRELVYPSYSICVSGLFTIFESFYNRKRATEGRGGVVNNSVSYQGDLGLKSRPEDRLS
jgi:hypothetical protein